MPDPEPRADPADAAPGEDSAPPAADELTTSSASGVPTVEAVAPAEERPHEQIEEQGPTTPPDEWEPPPDVATNGPGPIEPTGTEPATIEAATVEVPVTEAPAAEPASGQVEGFATGVLEIVESLDSDSHTASATDTGPATDVAELQAEASEPQATDERTTLPSSDDEAVAVPAEVVAVVPEAAAVSSEEAEAQGVSPARVPWWPFVAYLGVWIAALGVAAYELLQVPTGRALYEQVLYGQMVVGGLALTGLGVVLIPLVWLLARAGVEKARRGGLFSRTAFWGALCTLLGVLMWWGTLIVLDSVRLGRPL